MADQNGTLQIIQGSTYLQRQKQTHQVDTQIYLLLTVVLTTVGCALLCLSWILVSIGLPIVAGGGAGAGLVLLLYAAYTLRHGAKSQYQADNFCQGIAGEKIVADQLDTMLDARWTLFRNIILPGRQGDIDAVLVGPRGIFALEVKCYSGRHRYQGNSWHFRTVNGAWVEEQRHPGKQAYANAQQLQTWLAERGVPVSVQARLVWAGSGWLELNGGKTPVWFTRSPEYIERDLTSAPLHNPALLLKARQLLQPAPPSIDQPPAAERLLADEATLINRVQMTLRLFL